MNQPRHWNEGGDAVDLRVPCGEVGTLVSEHESTLAAAEAVHEIGGQDNARTEHPDQGWANISGGGAPEPTVVEDG